MGEEGRRAPTAQRRARPAGSPAAPGHRRRRPDLGAGARDRPPAEGHRCPVRLTHIGGPTLLVEVAGWRIVTDPTFDPPGRRYAFGWGTSSRKLTGPALRSMTGRQAVE